MTQYIKQVITIVLLFCAGSLSITAQGYQIPKYQQFKLPNGLTIYLMEQKEVPVISLSMVIAAGAIYDGNKAGLASLTATALKHGTVSYSRAALDEALDFMGASISTFASKESSGIAAKFASKEKEKVLTMIKEVVMNPTFDGTEFEKEKKKLLTNLEQQKESPRFVMAAYFDKFMFSSHVYGNIIQGKKSTVNDLTVNDVKTFYKANYLPEGSAMAVVGDFNSNEIKALLTKLFAGWKKGNNTSESLASKPIAYATGNNVLLINKDDARETTFYVGAPGISRNNPDYIAIDVINTLFGGRFTSMLNDELRVNTGLTYGAGSRFSALKNGGTFIISTFTANKTTEAAIDKTLEVLNNLHKNGIDEAGLASAKNYVKGQFPSRYETAAQLAGLMTQMFWYGFNESFINNFEKNVDGLTLEKAKKIIAMYFPKDKLQLVLVGKASEIRGIVAKYGKVTEVQIKEEIVN